MVAAPRNRPARARGSVAALVVAMLAAATSVVVVPARSAGAAVTADECLVRESYSVFLDRRPSGAEISWWEAVFSGGSPRSTLPDELAGSDEWLGVEVDKLYDAALDRAPDPGGRAYWIGRLAAGALVNEVGASIYGSDELYSRAGGTPAGFVTDLYDRILGRAPDAAGLAYWEGQVAGQGRGAVAWSFFASTESRTRRVTELYHQVLGRAPDAGGLTYWVGRLATVNDVRLAVLLASSPEFSSRAQTVGSCAPPLDITGGTGLSQHPSVSGDGRTVVFQSTASDLDGGDTNGAWDVFLWDRATGWTVRVSNGNYDSVVPVVSADGSTVAYSSAATDLVPGDGNGFDDVFVWDRDTGETIQVTEGNDDSHAPSVSADGSTVVFESDASNLLSGYDNGQPDVFLWDRTTGSTVRVTGGNGPSGGPVVSADGGTVVFHSAASDLVPGDANGQMDVFMWKRATGVTTRLTDGNAGSYGASVSAGGSVVAFESSASDLTTADTHGAAQIFRWDAASGSVTQLTDGTANSFDAAVSADGGVVAFSSYASDLAPGDTNGQPDVFAWDESTGAIRRLTDGDATSVEPAVSADGNTIAYAWQPPPPEPHTPGPVHVVVQGLVG